jgi:leucyl aminopeptidase (aminopeptidase T)
MTVKCEDAWFRSISELSNQQLRVVPPQMRAALAETDFYIFTMGPRKPIPWHSIPKTKQKLVSVWLDTRYDKSPYARQWAKISHSHEVRMLAIEATLATPERAKPLGLNHREWRNVMFQGCLANHKEIVRRSRVLSRLLSGNGMVRIATPSGTELSLILDRRPVGISDGMATKDNARKGLITFLPAGAIEVSVNEERAEGRVVYDAPVRMGNNMIKGLEVRLKEGRIKNYLAARGAGIFRQYLHRGGRDAGRFAFIGFGLNPNLRHGFTQDDKVLGGVTLGFGSNRTMGGKNKASEQWWASITRATVSINGTEMMEKGKLLV